MNRRQLFRRRGCGRPLATKAFADAVSGDTAPFGSLEPASAIEPLLVSVRAVTVVFALKPGLPMFNVPVLVSLPPKVAELPPSPLT